MDSLLEVEDPYLDWVRILEAPSGRKYSINRLIIYWRGSRKEFLLEERSIIGGIIRQGELLADKT